MIPDHVVGDRNDPREMIADEGEVGGIGDVEVDLEPLPEPLVPILLALRLQQP
ncbi:hypothetical protein D3C83_301650 [compost metagenome]